MNKEPSKVENYKDTYLLQKRLLSTKNLMKPLKSRIKKYKIISLDVETYSRLNKFYIAGIYDGENYTLYESKTEIIKYLLQVPKDTIVFCTNLGFDYNSIIEGTDLFNFSKIIIKNGRYLSVKLRGQNNDILFLDTMNFAQLSLSTLGKIINYPKYKHPRCLGKKPLSKKEYAELLNYNRRDCEVTQKFVVFLQEAFNRLGCEMKYTIGSTAMNLFRRKYLKNNILRESKILGQDVKSKIFLAYYGGRTEAFSRGLIQSDDETKYYYGDVNSLYPSVMKNLYPIPDSVRYYEDENRLLLNYMGVSYFELEIPYTYYPLLPCRINTKLLFPYGKLKGYYTHLEINRAIELYGEQIIKKMNNTVYYTEQKKYFEGFVNDLFAERQKEKAKGSPLEIVYKLLLNNLYGKFAQKNFEDTVLVNVKSNEQMRNVIKEAGNFNVKLTSDSVNNIYYIKKSEFDGVYSIPIWSVYVTAYARIKLHKLLCEYDAIYTDTDSIISTKEVINSGVLGELKLEHIIKKGIIIKPKIYFTDDDLKLKGVPIPKELKDKLRLKKKILRGDIIKYQKFLKIKESIKRDMKVNSIVVQEKLISLEDDKRVWKEKFNAYEQQKSEPRELK